MPGRAGRPRESARFCRDEENLPADPSAQIWLICVQAIMPVESTLRRA
jgi:hypothetical protein